MVELKSVLLGHSSQLVSEKRPPPPSIFLNVVVTTEPFQNSMYSPNSTSIDPYLTIWIPWGSTILSSTWPVSLTFCSISYQKHTFSLSLWFLQGASGPFVGKYLKDRIESSLQSSFIFCMSIYSFFLVSNVVLFQRTNFPQIHLLLYFCFVGFLFYSSLIYFSFCCIHFF